MENTTVKGGIYANIYVQMGDLKIKDVTTVQEKATSLTNTQVIGAGIIVESANSNVTIEGKLNQYNWLSEKDAGCFDSKVWTLLKKVFDYSEIYHTINSTKYANAGIIFNILKSIRITANSQIITSGYHAGDFYIDARWKQFLGTSNRNVGALVFDVNLNRQSADWFEEYYYSNNFRWDNDFNQETYFQLKGSYQLPFLEIGLKQTNISNYIYFGTNAKPQQYIGDVSISTLYSIFNIKLNKFETIGYASLQITNNNKIIHLPYFQGKIKLAYNIDLVKNISMMQPSIVINYFTAYYADAYMPALRIFYLQEDVKVGNFPYIDLCVTFKIKNANVFVLYTNMYSLTGDNRYFTTPHYPMRDSRLCLGVKWRLYK